MSRYEQWDIVTGVGITALGVAAGRAMETHRSDGLVSDPFADGFVAAAHPPVPMPTRLEEVGDDTGLAQLWTSMSDYLGVRSRFFDRYLADAASSGADQVVVLAAGLDTRAYRLDWPDGCDLFEVDQPEVLRFKDEVLDGQGARARCRRRTVAVDLREDWPSALRETGFDAGRPTAWLAEGLLPYLPADAERELYGNLHELAAPGSRLALEYVDGAVLDDLDASELRRASDQMGVDLTALWHTEGKGSPEPILAELGWTCRTEAVAEVARRYGRQLHGPMARTGTHGGFLTARR